jgi:hypothetical protein
MSGVKRRSGYRKNVMSEMEEFHEPKENEFLARVVGTRGGNTFEVAKWKATEKEEEMVLVLLPTRFRKLIWLKRGDYVIISCGSVVGTSPLTRCITCRFYFPSCSRHSLVLYLQGRMPLPVH